MKIWRAIAKLFKTKDRPVACDALISDRLVAIVGTTRLTLPTGDWARFARDTLYLTRSPRSSEAIRHKDHATKNYKSDREIGQNNCSIVFLFGSSARTLFSKKRFSNFEKFAVPFGWSRLWVLLGLLRYGNSGRLQIIGTTQVIAEGKPVSLLILENKIPKVDNRRQYGPVGLSPLEIVRSLEGTRHVVLRWPEKIANGEHTGDIDILIDSADSAEVMQRLHRSVGTYPLDLYTEDGSGRFYFAKVPYFVPKMAREILKTAEISAEGVHHASPHWRLVSFGYHLLFHIKSRRVKPGTILMSDKTFTSPHYLRELQRLAEMACVPAPRSFDDIEHLIREAGVFPSIDLLGFYSQKNPFLKHRYFRSNNVPPGLATFFIRDFGKGQERVADIRAMLKTRFTILAEGPFTPGQYQNALSDIRGGNWTDAEAEGGVAPPIYWFVCWDSNVVPPSRRTRKKQPRVDNENLNFKLEIRSKIGTRTLKDQRILHGSDNTSEALEHLEKLGLTDQPDLREKVQKLGLSQFIAR